MPLILTRKLNESILIAPGVRVTIHRIREHEVKLRIEAPEGTKILRAELEGTPPKPAHRVVVDEPYDAEMPIVRDGKLWFPL